MLYKHDRAYSGVDRHAAAGASLGRGVFAFRPQQQQRTRRVRQCDYGRCKQTQTRTGPSSTTIGMLPPLPSSFEYDDAVVFIQRATSTRIVGRDQLQRCIENWDRDFRSEVSDGNGDFLDETNEESLQLRRSVRLQTSVAKTLSPTTLLLRWNLTYVDSSVAWLVSLADIVPGWTPEFRTYTDQASKVRKFSYTAVGRLFASAFATGRLRVPLACIEGTATCEFREEDNDGNDAVASGENKGNSKPTTKKIISITEDLAYAQDLTRGALSNRLCAIDLQFFLEVARKPPEYRNDGTNHPETKKIGGLAAAKSDNIKTKPRYEYWEDLVTESLPWRSVPGMMDSMYIVDQSEEDLEAKLPLTFGILSVVLVLVFANWIAPALIGQSLFGAPSYIVPPSELNDIIRY